MHKVSVKRGADILASARNVNKNLAVGRRSFGDAADAAAFPPTTFGTSGNEFSK